MIVAGIDEAGYGPLLGPLVVSATAFRLTRNDTPPPDTVDAVLAMANLWPMLATAVVARPPVRGGKIIVADSKVVHALTDGLRLLEQTILGIARLIPSQNTTDGNRHSSQQISNQITVPTLTELLLLLGESTVNFLDQPWYDPHGLIPRFGSGDSISLTANMLCGTFHYAAIEPVVLHSRVVTEHTFNRLVEKTNNKASALISLSFQHLSTLYHCFAAEGLLVVVDKQGGRDRYLDLLLQSFPDARIKVIVESSIQSGYILTEDDRRAVICFMQKAEHQSFPTALASMICKYLREVMMDDFNLWFAARIENLSPTAGYYQDAQRWLDEAGRHFDRLGIQRSDLIRSR